VAGRRTPYPLRKEVWPRLQEIPAKAESVQPPQLPIREEQGITGHTHRAYPAQFAGSGAISPDAPKPRAARAEYPDLTAGAHEHENLAVGEYSSGTDPEKVVVRVAIGSMTDLKRRFRVDSPAFILPPRGGRVDDDLDPGAVSPSSERHRLGATAASGEEK
jgi:hypothetical protein